jgi:hypothetical protein
VEEPVLSVTADGSVRATVGTTAALFPGQTVESVRAGYAVAYQAVAAVLEPRWGGFAGADNLSAAEFGDLVARIVLHHLYFYNINYRDLGVPFWAPPHDDLRHPGTYREVRSAVARRRAGPGSGATSPAADELAAALLGLDVDRYRDWVVGDDRYQNR